MKTPWILVGERLPREDETLDGRFPVIDKDGYLVTGLLLDGYIMTSSEQPAVYWMPVQPPLKR